MKLNILTQLFAPSKLRRSTIVGFGLLVTTYGVHISGLQPVVADWRHDPANTPDCFESQMPSTLIQRQQAAVEPSSCRVATNIVGQQS